MLKELLKQITQGVLMRCLKVDLGCHQPYASTKQALAPLVAWTKTGKTKLGSRCTKSCHGPLKTPETLPLPGHKPSAGHDHPAQPNNTHLEKYLVKGDIEHVLNSPPITFVVLAHPGLSSYDTYLVLIDLRLIQYVENHEASTPFNNH